MNTESIYHFLEHRQAISEETEKKMSFILEKYPWFGGGQLLYALMKKKSGSRDADTQMAKAQLFLSNPLWANWQSLHADEHIFTEPDFQTSPTEETPVQIEELSTTETEEIERTEEAETLPEISISVVEEAVENIEKDSLTIPTEEPPVQIEELSTTETEELEKTKKAEMLPEISISIREQTAEDTVLSFEPFHTVDYFASQGIRLKQEQFGNDQFSKQVKTFTQWLQTMKKMYHTDQHATVKQEDKTITRMADASNEPNEIITETMAEVLLQQGKTIQAIALFEKLSLLHPEKSSYFTARILEIKK